MRRVGLALVGLLGCIGGGREPDDGDRDNDVIAPACKDGETGGPRDLEEDRAVYDQDDGAVLEIALAGGDAALAAVDGDDADATADVTVSSDDYTGPAVLEQRGRTARLANQKSYKLHLPEGATWRGQREVNLNKHAYDLSRVRQRLALALYRSVPHLTGLRTQLVHLTINGDDRGLYTQVEEPDETFLVGHGLDPDGSLYKAESFSFGAIDAATASDEARLDAVLDAKAGRDTGKLLSMVRDVNDLSKDINDVIARHLNRRNYVSWLAVSMLIGQFDNNVSNFFLYSPSTCASWYVLPWDLDSSLGQHEQPGGYPRLRWQAGIANWWLSTLHQRFLSDERNREDLIARMAELREGPLARGAIEALLAADRETIAAYVAAPPDSFYLPGAGGQPADRWAAEYERVAGAVDDFAAEFDAVLERPMPVVLYQVPDGDTLTFQWSPSVDFQGDRITYDFDLSRSIGFDSVGIALERHGLGTPYTTIDRPPPGTYYWRVITRDDDDPEGNFQPPFIEGQEVVVD